MLALPGNLSNPQYRIPYSLRFRSSASAYLSRTPAAGNRNTWTWSGWVKRGQLGASQSIFAAYPSSTVYAYLQFNSSDQIRYSSTNSSANLITTAVYRDPSAWTHIVLVYDDTQATSSNRLKLYVNGVQVTAFGTASYPTQNFGDYINSANAHNLGRFPDGSLYFDGYMAEVNFIDGQALTPAAFGKINPTTGVWVPKDYTGTYGTNGFYLKFADNSAASATAIGKDSSGNSNNWTPTNISLVAGSTFDSMTDTPTPYAGGKYYSGWNPDYGLQFRSSANATLSRTPASAGNRTTWTWSGWVKRIDLSTSTHSVLFSRVVVPSSNEEHISFDADNKLTFHDGFAGVPLTVTSNTYTDISAWYHVVFAYDSAQPVPSDRGKFYVNGVLQSSVTNNISLSRLSYINTASTLHALGGWGTYSTGSIKGILADINFVDGQALTPAAFGETNSSGVWVPKTYTGTYGTNGFYLNFANRSAMTAATIGDDASSNNNQWTPNNMVISDAIDYGDQEARGNYATLNPVGTEFNSTSLLTEGNLKFTGASDHRYVPASFAFPTTGKWYAEVTLNSVATGPAPHNLGVTKTTSRFGTQGGGTAATFDAAVYLNNLGQSNNQNQVLINGVYTNIQTINTLYTQAANDIFKIAYDSDTGKVWLGVNNQWFGPNGTNYNGDPAAGTNMTGTLSISSQYIVCNGGLLTTSSHNFGQRPFAYTPPTGFKALCTQNLPTPSIINPASYMAATTYTGTGIGRTITNTVNNKSFQPDLVWIKGRSGATDHALYDSVRGVQKDLVSNSTAAETTQSTGLTAFGSNGFSIGGLAKLNTSAATYAAWQWKESVAAGLDVVSYTGTGVARTVSHNLGIAPAMIIVKDTSATVNWVVYHSTQGANKLLRLNTTDAVTTDAVIWNNTSPTSSVFSVGGIAGVNINGNNYVAYCFSAVAGYSAFGSYTGNGSSDGPFVFTGFRPRFVLVKRTDAAANWVIIDAARNSYNAAGKWLLPDSSAAEFDYDASYPIDILSNGFKLRTSVGSLNSGTFIYAAFAEVPSKYALAR